MIPYGSHYIDEDDIQAVVTVLKDGPLTQGPRVGEFERAVASYVGAKHAVAVASGTAALHLAALVAGVGPGSTLVTSPISFVASANAALYVGGKPCFADIDEATANIDPASLRHTLEAQSDVRAVVPVHFAGLPCDMPAIAAEAAKSNALVIEDAAHALGADYPDGTRVGNCAHSAMTVFSFHPVKAFTAGEGGMITTNDDAIYQHLLQLRSHGITAETGKLQDMEQGFSNGIKNPWYYEMQNLGFHYRITDIQCGLAMSQLKKLPKFVARRRQLALQYDAAFADMEHCRPAQTTGRGTSGHHLYVLRIDYSAIGRTRTEFIFALRELGV